MTHIWISNNSPPHPMEITDVYMIISKEKLTKDTKNRIKDEIKGKNKHVTYMTDFEKTFEKEAENIDKLFEEIIREPRDYEKGSKEDRIKACKEQFSYQGFCIINYYHLKINKRHR